MVTNFKIFFIYIFVNPIDLKKTLHMLEVKHAPLPL